MKNIPTTAEDTEKLYSSWKCIIQDVIRVVYVFHRKALSVNKLKKILYKK